jgi:hypothetical protein
VERCRVGAESDAALEVWPPESMSAITAAAIPTARRVAASSPALGLEVGGGEELAGVDVKGDPA